MSRAPSTGGLAVVTLLSVALLAVGGILSVRPGLLLEAAPALESLLATLDPGTVVLAVIGLLVAAAASLGVIGRVRFSSRPLPLVDPTAESEAATVDESTADYPVAGASFDRQLELATAYDDQPRSTREEARRRLVDSLRPIAATAYANRAGLTEADALAAVEAGTWTDDPRAAAFLGGDDGPSTPLWLWLVDLVSTADPFRRSLERTIAEIDRVQSTPAVETGSTETDRTSPGTDSNPEATS
ncbi:DUF7269 family protein [Natrinema salsiterrestre]|uniref:Uncharacterized protein n=1 Tax=Natrinema salsiterrestre TaxID=2950540 RepID=A0A9Q4KX75_9EURY|nr:hypothetical protein [Natrinema salsiterrestre]MDF9744863.1 hypothetical protein [Natrinema salsiterrestre]